MIFERSSQRKRWLFSTDELTEIRTRRRQACLDAVAKEETPQPEGVQQQQQQTDIDSKPAKKSKKTRPPSLAEEAALLKYYSGKIQEMCRAFGFPNKVQAAAVLFLKRFYLHYSTLQHDPKNILLTAIYLAGKVEEAYIGAEEFCKRLQQDEEVVLNTEPLVLQGLNFDLITYSPYTSLSGYFADLEDCQKEGSVIDPPLQELGGDTLAQARAAARAAVDALMLTDAPLLFPPGQLALAAMRSGCNKVKVPLGSFLSRVAGRAQEEARAGCSTEDIVQELKSAFGRIDSFGSEGSQQVKAEEVRKIDRRLKAFHAVASKASSASQQDTGGHSEATATAQRQKALEGRGEREGTDGSAHPPLAKRLKTGENGSSGMEL
ncbi:cyclin-like protein [Coccomyxa subellipsoidea C-169]|uniref:Cyclin-like protein n=1 Tax=Coccomyxa subellipsoidea (strain C-169) TaxID=574566 RepID=I0Z7S7_COCSC|nr:cyclin-like protein [Coccomyxa subellipsoidea C-169]EIE26696.1 cyclin-like protein [Coccomyxa subellipsoidea C-169]|eukprot:XP_005651240.1 cyclin-like protein [Coccomyxa subellipsoidea C-169]